MHIYVCVHVYIHLQGRPLLRVENGSLLCVNLSEMGLFCVRICVRMSPFCVGHLTAILDLQTHTTL